MDNTIYSQNWRLIGKSVTGAVHQLHNKTSQDCFKIHNEEPLILAVADGHGSQNSPFSDLGAQLAVEVGVDTCLKFYNHAKQSNLKLDMIKQMAEEELPKIIVKEWVQKVTDDYQSRRDIIEGSLDIGSLLVKYGSTLLIALLSPNFHIYLQLGDGDILLVDEKGIVSSPISRDQRLIGNQTTSLCSPEAWKEIRTAFFSSHEPLPALILLASDGYSNSYKSEADFHKVGQDYHFLAQKYGIKLIEEKLEEWLHEVSAQGSGDDITACLAFRSMIYPGDDQVNTDDADKKSSACSSADIQSVRE